MARGAKTGIGLDIGSHTVKMVELSRAGEKWELTNYGIGEIYPGGEASHVAEEIRQAAIDCINKVREESGIAGKEVVAAVSGQSVIVRYVDMPRMTKEELQEAIKFEAEQYIPFSMDEVALDFQILEEATPADAQKMRVLIVAAKKDLIDSRMEIAGASGLELMAIDVDSFALMNAFEVAGVELEEDDVVALVNAGAEITSINILKNRISCFTREISMAGNSITAAIGKGLSIDIVEAEKLKKEEGIVFVEEEPPVAGEEGEKKKEISEVVKPILDDLAGEMRLSFDYYENQALGKGITKVFLAGGSAGLANLDKFLSLGLGVATQVWNPFSSDSISPGRFGEEAVKIGPLLSVGMGLALRG